MIGVYNYTVVLTYLSLISAGVGICVALAGGHPYLGMLFLMLSGLFDGFDGKVARTKKNRTELEKNYGIQIESLTDVVAFGVLPGAIGASVLRTSAVMAEAGGFVRILCYAVLVFYMLAAMIRLAYFNVTEEERQRTEGGSARHYTGLPVTASALIFPTVLMLMYLIPADIGWLYFCVALLTGFAFILDFKVKKPGLKTLLAMVAIGLAEFIVIMIFRR